MTSKDPRYEAGFREDGSFVLGPEAAGMMLAMMRWRGWLNRLGHVSHFSTNDFIRSVEKQTKCCEIEQYH